MAALIPAAAAMCAPGCAAGATAAATTILGGASLAAAAPVLAAGAGGMVMYNYLTGTKDEIEEFVDAEEGPDDDDKREGSVVKEGVLEESEQLPKKKVVRAQKRIERDADSNAASAAGGAGEAKAFF